MFIVNVMCFHFTMAHGRCVFGCDKLGYFIFFVIIIKHIIIIVYYIVNYYGNFVIYLSDIPMAFNDFPNT